MPWRKLWRQNFGAVCPRVRGKWLRIAARNDADDEGSAALVFLSDILRPTQASHRIEVSLTPFLS